MKILTFTSLFPDAVRPELGIFVYQRVAHLAERPGNTVLAIAPVPYFPKWLPIQRWREVSCIPAQEKIGNIIVFHPRYLLLPKLMPLHGLLMFLGTVRLVKRLHAKENFDCIDAHYVYPDGFAAALIGKMLNLPVIVSARGTDINVFPSFPTIQPMIKWTLRRASGVVTVCTSLKKKVEQLGIQSGKVQVIGNGVDLQKFQPLDRQHARKALGLHLDGEILVAVGSLRPVKGWQYLIPAFAQIASMFPASRLYIVGTGNYRKHLHRLVQDMSLEHRVFLVGTQSNEQLKLWFNAANVSCLTSSHEGWPNVLLESLACGTPVVATNVDGVPEIIVSDNLGLLTPQDVQSIAERLKSALAKDWDRATLVTYASKRTWAIVAAEVENYFLKRTATCLPSANL